MNQHRILCSTHGGPRASTDVHTLTEPVKNAMERVLFIVYFTGEDADPYTPAQLQGWQAEEEKSMLGRAGNLIAAQGAEGVGPV